MVRLSLAFVFCLVPTLAHAQLLGSASSAVRGGSSSSSSSQDDDDDDDGSWGQESDRGWNQDDGLISGASRSVRGSSSSGRARSRRSSRGSSSGGLDLSFFAPCPYGGDDGDDFGGYLMEPVRADGSRRLARPAVRLSLELGYAIEGAGRGGVAARLSVPFLLDFRVRYSTFLESVDDGWDVAALGRIGLELRVLETEGFILRLGGAGLHFHDVDGAVPGLEGSLSADWFVARPVVLSAEFGAGFVGEAASLSARMTVGTMLDSTELYFGYHYEGLLVGNTHVHLGGPVAGVRGWL